MSAKSSIKSLVPKDQHSRLFKWVSFLTGSKNALKGIGFFIGSLLLVLIGFQSAIILMASLLFIVAIFSSVVLTADIGKSKNKPKFTAIFSNKSSLNYLSAARMCLFAARDVWFVIAVPVYLSQQLGWEHEFVGGFLAIWVIAYGIVQSVTPKILNQSINNTDINKLTSGWSIWLALFTFLFAVSLFIFGDVALIVIAGLFVFGIIFAINSSLHSFAIVAIAREDGVSMDVGFYYMANALGRLLGTLLSGWVFQTYNILACLIIAGVLAGCSAYYMRKVTF